MQKGTVSYIPVKNCGLETGTIRNYRMVKHSIGTSLTIMLAYLWTVVGTTWTAYKPYTGRWVATFTGVPAASGTPTYTAKTEK